MWMIGLI